MNKAMTIEEKKMIIEKIYYFEWVICSPDFHTRSKTSKKTFLDEYFNVREIENTFKNNSKKVCDCQ